MNWMNEVFYLLLMTSFTGAIAYLIWMALARWMERKKKLWFVLPMLVIVLPFFLLPIGYLQLKLFPLFGVSEGASSGILFVRTPLIYILQSMIAAFWIMGAILNLIIYIMNVRELKQLLKRTCLPAEERIHRKVGKIADELKIRGDIMVSYSYGVSSAMVTGLFHKRIVLPVQKYNEQELETALYHELVHVKQRILFWKSVGSVIKIIHWLNPCAHYLMRSLDEWGETACDLTVHYETEYGLSFKEYFNIVLIGIERAQEHVSAATTQLGKKKGIKERIMKIKNYNKEKDLRVATGILAVCLFCVGCTTTALAAGTGFGKLYGEVYEGTVKNVEENAAAVTDGLTEYEDCIDLSAVNVVEAETNDRTRSAVTLNWDIPGNTLYKTNRTYYAKAGGTITVNIGVDPSNRSVKVGIMTPDGIRRYVDSSGNITHSFSLDATGSYYVFVENGNSSSVSVAGSFTY